MRFVPGALAMLGAAGCTDVGLYRLEAVPPADSIHAPETILVLRGRYCSSDPGVVAFPVKLLFVLDDSGSMALSDAQFRRLDAAGALAEQLLQQDQTYVGVEKFQNTQSTLVTNDPVFTRDPATVRAALDPSQHAPGGGTPYLSAFAVAATAIQQDIAADPETAARTRYVVLFLSDGAPTDDQLPYAAIQDTVTTLMQLPGAGEVTVHAAYLQDGGANFVAAGLLQTIATLGDGQYRSFPDGDALDFSDYDASSLSVPFVPIAPILVSNLTARPGRRASEPDSDADGLLDSLELAIGTDPRHADSDRDTCSDLMERHDFQTDPLDPGDCGCNAPALVGIDVDQDGLSACAELLIGSDDERPDSDWETSGEDYAPDSMLDPLELTWGLLPNLSDAELDYDGDGVENIVEIVEHTDPQRDETAEAREVLAYRYELTEVDGEPCVDFVVGNIALVPTLATADHAAGINEILLYFIEAPKPTPTTGRAFRRLVKEVPYVADATEPIVVELTPAEFVRSASVW